MILNSGKKLGKNLCNEINKLGCEKIILINCKKIVDDHIDLKYNIKYQYVIETDYRVIVTILDKK
jgi:hypothetical protein